ncbi:hypothetical protein P691DRAFT_789400 [Macrolepiota fuliginosa MF-IS2]|uniref:Uncharacterized protein n=1 Tax=Macrolepiota fuliginosa MF-IS2 TaxID=1400762 RepID=A0A9P5X1B7_9AGAR|nr:hypothetical protein P691DRAFT_789400 [Macrolepiota fuliginosa MF-IS2]
MSGLRLDINGSDEREGNPSAAGNGSDNARITTEYTMDFRRSFNWYPRMTHQHTRVTAFICSFSSALGHRNILTALHSHLDRSDGLSGPPDDTILCLPLVRAVVKLGVGRLLADSLVQCRTVMGNSTGTARTSSDIAREPKRKRSYVAKGNAEIRRERKQIKRNRKDGNTERLGYM